jgi:predicted O-linked N-acetylglucosamine transferase (SPINDLY family)
MVILKPGRNDPCVCGSGKKYKKCCEAKSGLDSPAPRLSRQEAAPTPAECNQVAALFSAGRHEEMEHRARLLLERYPASGFVWKALSISLLVRGKEALPAFQKAAKFLPNDAEAQLNLGNALKNLGQLDQAVTSYRRALEIKPNYAEAHSNLGNALKNLGHLDRAVASYRRALEIKPDYAVAHSNLGNALNNLGLLDEAVASHRRALEIKPDYAEAHINLGVAFLGLGQLENSVASYRRALEIKPDLVEAHIGLGSALQDLGQLDDAMASFRRALEIKPDDAQAHSDLLLLHNYLCDQPAAVMLADARRFGDLAARQARPHTGWRNAPEAGKCLRVGWVSGDLRAHPVGYFVEGVMAELASSFSGRLELVAYSSHFHADVLTARIKACCHGWRSAAGLSDEALARQIRDDGIDILIDLAGHTAHNRLPMFAWKPAPVQATWLGFLGTTGVSAIDYLIADPWTLPVTEEENFNEKIWRLPETYLCFTPPSDDIPVSALPAGSDGFITFGCFNNLTKINNAVVALWARLLDSVPGSRLLLKVKQLDDPSARQDIVERFARQGIGEQRLILEGSVKQRVEHLATYQRVDIALDPFPYPGITTSAESLWMGVPVLTLAGQSFLSRQGVGILMNAGLPDWIAVDADDYVAKALAHASDLSRLATLRSGLRQQVLASPLFDAPRFAGNFEAALRGMWTHWCYQQGKK